MLKHPIETTSNSAPTLDLAEGLNNITAAQHSPEGVAKVGPNGAEVLLRLQSSLRRVESLSIIDRDCQGLHNPGEAVGILEVHGLHLQACAAHHIPVKHCGTSLT